MSEASSTNPAIQLVGVTRLFKDKLAVDQLSLQVERGRVLGLIGPNGAGKSTTIRMAMGLLEMTAGEARVLGMDVRTQRDEIKQSVGYVPEQHFIHRWMRVREVLAFCRTFYQTWNERYSRELIALLGLDEQQKVQALSKGMLTKLALVVALAHEPELLILDEPMAGLDPLVREEIVEGVLRDICDHQRTVVFSSHTLSDVARLADVVAIINEGRILAQAPTADLLSQTKRIRAVLQDGCQPALKPAGMICDRIEGREWLMTVKDFSADLPDRLRSSNPLSQVEVVDLGLEEVFKDYIRGARRTGAKVLA